MTTMTTKKIHKLVPISAAVVTALSLVAGVAYAQIKSYKLPPGAMTPKGVSLKDVTVRAKCGSKGSIDVTLQYNTPVAVKATLWGTIGDQKVDVPAGNSTKTYSFPTAVALTCQGPGMNHAQVLDAWVALGESSAMMTSSYTTVAAPAGLPK